ncbi:MAG: outer membrane beta-barrel protein [Endomicrobiales bacterium]
MSKAISYNIRYIFYHIVLLAFVIMFPGPFALAEIKTGNLSIEPYVRWVEMYDTNIYLDATNKKYSWITNLSPGVNLFLPVKDHKFQLQYNAEFIGYSENPGNNNAINNNINLLAGFNFPVGLFAEVNDYYRNTTDPLTTELIQRVNRNQNMIYTKVGCLFSRFLSSSLGFSQVLHDYIAEAYKPLLNRRENEANVEIAYNYSPKTSALVGYACGTVDYSYASNLNSSKYNQVTLGVRGELTPKTVGEIKVGEKARTYNNVAGRDVSTPTLSLATITTFSKRTQLSLVAGRNFVESIYFNNLYYIDNSLQGMLSQKIYRDWTATFDVRYEFIDYPQGVVVNTETKKRQDSYILNSFDITYAATEWLSVGIDYTVRQRNSNIDLYYYLDNIIGLNAKVVY